MDLRQACRTGLVLLFFSVAAMGGVDTSSSTMEKMFLGDFRDAWRLVKAGRQEEGRLLLNGLTSRLDDVSMANRPTWGERLARALEAVNDRQAARKVRTALVVREQDAAPSHVGDASDETAGIDLFEAARQPGLGAETSRSLMEQALARLTRVANAGARVVYRRGLCLEALERFAEARDELLAAQKLDPNDPYAKFAYARIAWRLGDRARSIEAAASGLGQSIDRQGTELLADVFRQMKYGGRRDEALALCRKWADYCGRDVAVTPLRVVVAESHEEIGEPTRAVDEYALIPKVERDPVAASGLARASMAAAALGPEQRRYTVKMLEGLVPPTEDSSPALLRVAGSLSLEDGNRAGAVRYFRAGLKTSDWDFFAEALRGLGVVVDRRPEGRARPAPEIPFATLPTFDQERTGQLADYVLKAMGRADQSPRARRELINMALGAAMEQPLVKMLQPGIDPDPKLVASLTRKGPPTPLDAEAYRNTLPDCGARQRYQLVESFVTGDTQGAQAVLASLRDAVPPVTPPRTMEQEPDPRRQEPEPQDRTQPGDDRPGQPPLPETPPRAQPEKPPAPPPPRAMLPEESPDTPPRLMLTDTPQGRKIVPNPSGQKIVENADAALADPATPPRDKLARVLDVARMLPTPIVVDTNGNGRADLTRHRDRAVRFDVAGRGTPQLVQWIDGGQDAWLAEDIDGDGQIASGHELFGSAGGFANGFEKLALRDRDGDRRIAGAELDRLQLWADVNGNGLVDPGELMSVAARGLTAIVLPESGLTTRVEMNGCERSAWDVLPGVFDF
ncbi:MAG: hypothetical protein HY815_30915 [Candidatus Riflebacteria bacterium]|nr:hypothetical protein [Candidatus Riflebacteria bacterium]